MWGKRNIVSWKEKPNKTNGEMTSANMKYTCLAGWIINWICDFNCREHLPVSAEMVSPDFAKPPPNPIHSSTFSFCLSGRTLSLTLSCMISSSSSLMLFTRFLLRISSSFSCHRNSATFLASSFSLSSPFSSSWRQMIKLYYDYYHYYLSSSLLLLLLLLLEKF